MRAGHVALVGPTASGKSALALDWARAEEGWEIVSVDSMGVYRRMDIGTAKPTPAERAAVAHHCLDLVEPTEEFTVADFQRAARAALADVEARGRRALLVGGTGLYLRAVVDDLELPGRYPAVRAELEAEADEPGGLARLHRRLADADPVAAARMTPTNRRRVVRALEVTLGAGRRFSSFGPGLEAYPPTATVLVGLPLDAGTDARIAARLADQVAAGLLDEVRRLHRAGGLSRTARQALAYRELLDHLDGRFGLDEALALAERRTRAFARRQWAWFRRDPRVRWLHPGAGPGALLDAARAAAGALAGGS